MKQNILLKNTWTWAGFSLLLFLATIPLQAMSADTDGTTATTLIQQTVKKVVAVLDDKKQDQVTRRKRILQIIEPVFDFSLMAKLTLGRRYWPQLSAAQRTRFTDLFVDQLRRSYVDKIEMAEGREFTYQPPEIKRNKVSISSRAIGKASEIKLLYRLYQRKKQWRVYDVEIQGVSIVRSYAAQYADFLRTHSLTDLLQNMQKKYDANHKADDQQAAQKKK